jgi:ubiquinone/menaquinone biosynthesis C-methylase UbiE
MGAAPEPVVRAVLRRVPQPRQDSVKTYDELRSLCDAFFEHCERTVGQQPWAVCIAMHEFHRHLYVDDPYIGFGEPSELTERVHRTTTQLCALLAAVDRLGAYPIDLTEAAKAADVRDRTGDVYGKLWRGFTFEEVTAKATAILSERLTRNGIDLGFLRGKEAIDVGCGSGRFTLALSRLGCASVVGVDYGDEGLRIADEIAGREGMTGVHFRKADVLDLPYADGTFDFVFCNGVLHHTEDLERGISEVVRIARPGGKIWLYLYGDGGVFWYARKRMPLIMKRIPQAYTMAVLGLIGMPGDRFGFADNWYVPIERHTTDSAARRMIADAQVSHVERCEHGRSTDLENLALHGGEEGRIMYGDGELRYIITK